MLLVVATASLLAIALEPTGVHHERLASIERVNSVNGRTWTAKASPRFGHHAPGASASLLGIKGNWTKDIEAAINRGTVARYVPTRPLDPIPDAWDAAEAFPACATIINDIRDQSNCGCCWAFGGAEAASDRMCITSNASLLMPLSASDVCFNSNPDGCNGGQIDTPWTFLASTGVVTGGQFNGSGPFGSGYCADFPLPHCHHHGPVKGDPYPAEGEPGCPDQSSPAGPTACDSTATAPHAVFKKDKYTFTYQGNPYKPQSAMGETAIKQFMMEGGPCEVAFTVYSDFEDYDTGIYQHVTGDAVGGHAVKFVGWGVDNGVKYWKVANSWNPYWGESGFFRIAMGEGGIDAECIASPFDATYQLASDVPPSPPGPGPMACDFILDELPCAAAPKCHWCRLAPMPGFGICLPINEDCPFVEE